MIIIKSIEYKEYFDNIFKNVDRNIVLDDEQRKAILCQGNSIIVAGAGSGKTTTMAGKVKYLVDSGVNPKDIIIISYTNKAVFELKTRINDGFKIPCLICTFHKFALEIIKLNGFKYKILSDSYNIIYEYVLNRKKEISKLGFKFAEIVDFLSDFLKRFKNMGYGITKLDEWIEVLKKKELKFIIFFRDFYLFYTDYLTKNRLIDFEDIINKANDVLDNHSCHFRYKYIIVDEFQDISYQRFNLIYKMNQLYGCNIVVVGDDFQAIFEFAGSNVSLFTKFSKMLPDVTVLKITHTYRNSQELIDIAGGFVMKNPHQIKKNLISNKRLVNPVRIFYGRNKIRILDKIIKKISLEFKGKNILLLGRYNFDIDYFIDNVRFKKSDDRIIWHRDENLIIHFLSVHSAKGLGYDNVVILNGYSGEFGFPSMIVDNSVVNLVVQNNDDYYLSEERRLFYVALTRTKNRVYIVSSFFNSSIFVKELSKFEGVKKEFVFR